MLLRSLSLAFSLLALFIVPISAQTPTPAWSCSSATTEETATGHGHGGHDMHGDPASFDQLYIDMMVPHHEAVIALAEAALPHLTEPMLIGIAENVIASQAPENEQLLAWRLEWFGSAEPMMDDATMTQMMEAMPVSSMDEMMFQMDPAAQVASFCEADDPDRAFATQVLGHHQMAVDTSVIAVEQAEHPELQAFAEKVIVDQQAEIDLLEAFLAEGATPAA